VLLENDLILLNIALVNLQLNFSCSSTKNLFIKYFFRFLHNLILPDQLHLQESFEVVGDQDLSVALMLLYHFVNED